MVWPHLKILGHDNSAGDSERSKKERKTEDGMGRLHQGMDGIGVWRFPGAAEDREVWKGIVATSSVVPRTSRKLRNITLSIIFAILACFKLFVQFSDFFLLFFSGRL